MGINKTAPPFCIRYTVLLVYLFVLFFRLPVSLLGVTSWNSRSPKYIGRQIIVGFKKSYIRSETSQNLESFFFSLGSLFCV